MERRSVLIVEDSEVMRAFLVSALEDCGAEVVEAPTGFEALKLLPQYAFSVIITDINMPDINGLELIAFIKKHPQYQGIPILVISTERSEEDRRRALALGAVDYLVKPFAMDIFRNRVLAHLGGRPS
jgi:two-component system, chemotaxis family, chemotaxis protein CheY